jgi:hypothetical protein
MLEEFCPLSEVDISVQEVAGVKAELVATNHSSSRPFPTVMNSFSEWWPLFHRVKDIPVDGTDQIATPTKFPKVAGKERLEPSNRSISSQHHSPATVLQKEV